MELVFNLIWGVLAVAIVRLWVCHAPVEGVNRRTQVAALFLLLLILFPVISVTDDLQTMQNPAEVESTLRRVHAAVNAPSILPQFAVVPPSVFAEDALGLLTFSIRSRLPVPTVDNPALVPIQKRPPPAS